jgi:2-polyprenyl-6-methoxyphenol hydroxylase-like FAD-dependent oxidoreductase
MQAAADARRTVVVAGGGIGGVAAAIGLSRAGFRVTVRERAQAFGEIGAGIQLGPNVFHALKTRANGAAGCWATPDDLPGAFQRYQERRIARTARVVLSSRELGRLYHAAGVERLVRNDLFRNRTVQDFYRSLDWIYGYGRDAS